MSVVPKGDVLSLLMVGFRWLRRSGGFMSRVYRVALVALRALVSFDACMLGGCRARACLLFVLFLSVSVSVGLVLCFCLLCLSSLSPPSFFLVSSASVFLLCLSILH